MLPEDYDRFAIVNAMATYGVFSHFIHPDDIFDEDRGKGQSWETLYRTYCELMEWVHETYPFLRSLSSADAADALKVYQDAKPYITYTDDFVEGKIDKFHGELYFYLKTDKKPVAVDDSCTITKADEKDGSCYYVVQVKEAEFRVKLVEK